ncbi:hypothetical protein T4E_2491 [Trichinella pseudospiralis]|uniref:Uncharacterized protein n=1 Tax=Trichinella pseudospiralis TaxID=6337 RepID=A0A0V0WEP3_TRIPS|nr:hypothetical protein T4E_2491 [Trichinella pseudospiralis]
MREHFSNKFEIINLYIGRPRLEKAEKEKLVRLV